MIFKNITAWYLSQFHKMFAKNLKLCRITKLNFLQPL